MYQAAKPLLYPCGWSGDPDATLASHCSATFARLALHWLRKVVISGHIPRSAPGAAPGPSAQPYGHGELHVGAGTGPAAGPPVDLKGLVLALTPSPLRF